MAFQSGCWLKSVNYFLDERRGLGHLYTEPRHLEAVSNGKRARRPLMASRPTARVVSGIYLTAIVSRCPESRAIQTVLRSREGHAARAGTAPIRKRAAPRCGRPPTVTAPGGGGGHIASMALDGQEEARRRKKKVSNNNLARSRPDTRPSPSGVAHRF